MFEILTNYEELIAYVEEVRESLDLLHEWLNIRPNFNDMSTYYDLIVLHSSHFALLNLAMDKLDYLIEENRQIITKHMKGSK